MRRPAIVAASRFPGHVVPPPASAARAEDENWLYGARHRTSAAVAVAGASTIAASEVHAARLPRRPPMPDEYAAVRCRRKSAPHTASGPRASAWSIAFAPSIHLAREARISHRPCNASRIAGSILNNFASAPLPFEPLVHAETAFAGASLERGVLDRDRARRLWLAGRRIGARDVGPALEERSTPSRSQFAPYNRHVGGSLALGLEQRDRRSRALALLRGAAHWNQRMDGLAIERGCRLASLSHCIQHPDLDVLVLVAAAPKKKTKSVGGAFHPCLRLAVAEPGCRRANSHRPEGADAEMLRTRFARDMR